MIKLQHAFDVPTAPDRLWTTMLDVERVAGCLPGAEITEATDDEWRGRVKVKFGPVALSFAGIVTVQERDDDVHRLVLHGKGAEQRGKGSVTAVISTSITELEAGSRVSVESDLTLTGAVVQVSRGMLPDISERMMEQFAVSLRAMLAAEDEMAVPAIDGVAQPRPAAPQIPTAQAVPGIRTALWALWRMFRRSLRRLVTRGRHES